MVVSSWPPSEMILEFSVGVEGKCLINFNSNPNKNMFCQIISSLWQLAQCFLGMRYSEVVYSAFLLVVLWDHVA